MPVRDVQRMIKPFSRYKSIQSINLPPISDLSQLLFSKHISQSNLISMADVSSYTSTFSKELLKYKNLAQCDALVALRCHSLLPLLFVDTWTNNDMICCYLKTHKELLLCCSHSYNREMNNVTEPRRFLIYNELVYYVCIYLCTKVHF